MSADNKEDVDPMIDFKEDLIKQNKKNLREQHELLLQQQEVQVNKIIRKAQEHKIIKLAADNEFKLKELDDVLQTIVDSCNEDSISFGTEWIFKHIPNPALSETIVMYIFKKVTEPEATLETKMHLLWFINNLLHQCICRNGDNLKQFLERVVVPMFCLTSIGVDADKQQELEKLKKIWEKEKYFDANILEKIKNPTASVKEYQAELIIEHEEIVKPVITLIKELYSIVEKQHKEFVDHLTGHILMLPEIKNQPYSSNHHQEKKNIGHQEDIQPVKETEFNSQGKCSVKSEISSKDIQDFHVITTTTKSSCSMSLLKESLDEIRNEIKELRTVIAKKKPYILNMTTMSDKRNVTVVKSTIKDDMQNFVEDVATNAMNSLRSETDASRYIKEKVDKKYKRRLDRKGWTVVVGSQVGHNFKDVSGKYTFFYVGDIGILIYK